MTNSNAGSAGTKTKRKTVADLTEQYSAKAKTKVEASQEEKSEAKTDEFAHIADNTFFKIIFDESTSPTAKKEAVATALAYNEDKKQSQLTLEEFEAFKAYLQSERKNMARQIIQLTDTGTFSELQSVYGEINDSLLDFEKTMGPLTEIIDAIYSLRTSGVTLEIYEEIKRDKEAEISIAQKREEQRLRLSSLQNDMAELRQANAGLGTEKTFFGFGRLTKDAQRQIAINEAKLKDKSAELQMLTRDIESTAIHGMPTSEYGEFAAEKAKLRELLDISSDQHKARQEEMVAKAIRFVDTTEQRVRQVLTHFDGMNDQIDRLGEANYQMRSVYAVLSDATDEAGKITQAKRGELQTSSENLSEIEKLDIEAKLRNLENHVTALSKSDIDTTRVLAELTQAGSRVQAMKENNDQQVSKTRALHTSGVAGVADQLSTVLQAVSSAALGEASEAAKMSIQRMTNTTTDIAAKEAFRTALGIKGNNADLAKALDDLAQFGEVVQATANIRREALGDSRELLEKMQKQAEQVQADIRKANAIAADVVAGKGGVVREESNDNDEKAGKARKPDAFKLG